MEKLPFPLLAPVPHAERDAVRAWWTTLSQTDRADIASLFDERWETCFFGPVADTTPTVFGGRFLVGDDAWRFADWEDDWREYLVEHPEVFIQSLWVWRGFFLPSVTVDWSRVAVPLRLRPPSEQTKYAEPDQVSASQGRAWD